MMRVERVWMMETRERGHGRVGAHGEGQVSTRPRALPEVATILNEKRFGWRAQ